MDLVQRPQPAGQAIVLDLATARCPDVPMVLHPHHCVTEPDAIAGPQVRRRSHWLIVQPGAVTRSEIFDPPLTVTLEETHVMAGGARVGDHEAGRRSAADDDLRPVEIALVG